MSEFIQHRISCLLDLERPLNPQVLPINYLGFKQNAARATKINPAWRLLPVTWFASMSAGSHQSLIIFSSQYLSVVRPDVKDE